MTTRHERAGSASRPPDSMIRGMLELQDRMNRKINPDWINADYQFLRAALVESVEGLEHYGWKWWKRQEPNIGQLRMELVDIWHFLLSHYLLQAKGDLSRAAGLIANDWSGDVEVTLDGVTYPIPQIDTRAKLELFAACSALRRVSLPLFSALLDDCGMSEGMLYREYVSKNVLNHFRQDHGYKAGTYQKIWEGREDNEHMVDILAGLESGIGLADELYRALDKKYRAIVGQADKQ